MSRLHGLKTHQAAMAEPFRKTHAVHPIFALQSEYSPHFIRPSVNRGAAGSFSHKSSFRIMGISNLLLNDAIKYAKQHRAEYAEAFPVEPDLPGHRILG